MVVKILDENPSILTGFLNEIRDKSIQNDRLRYRRNIERIGEVMAYEVSQSLHYEQSQTETILGIKQTHQLQDEVVICSILRAGLALHQGILNYFDMSDSGFISANRVNTDAGIKVDLAYKSLPHMDNKTLLLVDPMLATGISMLESIKKLQKINQPKQIHILVVVAAPEGVQHLQNHLDDSIHLWVASMDDGLNEKSYIIPGLGDAGDLAYGTIF
ncbi:MAG: uracil phosphoribosyltransferase [Psychroflexus sp.]|nr:uracil phosphoribosyltransferase [Psychroflexus sp.]